MSRRMVAALALLVLLVAPVLVYVPAWLAPGSGREPPTAPASDSYGVLRVLGPGSYVTLEYALMATNGSGWTVLDRRTVEVRVLGVEWPFINTSVGPLPVAFLYPVTPAVDPGNPHFVYVSYYLGDASCMVLEPLPGEAGGFYAAPRMGCTLYGADVWVSGDGLLSTARLVIPQGNGTLLAEQVSVVAVSPASYTVIKPGDPLCLGPLSRDVMYTASGAYLVNGSTVHYLGKPPANATGMLHIWKYDPGAAAEWARVLEGGWEGVVIVSSRFADLRPHG